MRSRLSVMHRKAAQMTFDLGPERLGPGREREYGEVCTRRWVVELVLDLAGYKADRDLASMTAVEPSCGAGAFLGPMVERLLRSCQLHGRSVGDASNAVRAFDLLDANAAIARQAIVAQLVEAGQGVGAGRDLASEWVTADDFLLAPHIEASADFVLGNPPYVRLENVPADRNAAYRQTCPTMRGRSDVFIGFIEMGLRLLRTEGALGFIVADRWMRNQYGAALRELVADQFSVDAVIEMHDVDAFEDEVSAYPAVTVIRRGPQGTPVVASTTPERLAVLADLERRFPPLEDPATGTRVGIGLATGADDVYLTRDSALVEPDRLLPMVMAKDLAGGGIAWAGTYLVNPWDSAGLIDIDQWPLFRSYLDRHGARVKARHTAAKAPDRWWKTIDRMTPGLLETPKLLLPEMKASANPVLDEGRYYPHHNLCYVTSTEWDLEVLGGLMLSDVANLFVGVYCVKMRGGTYRFQAQYLRRIRVPSPATITVADRKDLAGAFGRRDVEAATEVAARVYGIDAHILRTGARAEVA